MDNFFNIVFQDTRLKLNHYYNSVFLSTLDEIEHILLINYIILNKHSGFSFNNTKDENINILIDGTYDKPFDGYKQIENCLIDNINLKSNKLDNLNLDYDLDNGEEIIIDVTHCNYQIGDEVEIVDFNDIVPYYVYLFIKLKMNNILFNGSLNNLKEIIKNDKFIITRIIKIGYNDRTFILLTNQYNRDLLIINTGIKKINE